uniref:Slit homolog 3 protein n=1 Tax=Sus scrofa TaxID=9823 RepID=A0A8D1IQ61_PIG
MPGHVEQGPRCWPLPSLGQQRPGAGRTEREPSTRLLLTLGRRGTGQRRVGRGGYSGRCPGTPPAGIPTSTGLSALRQGADRPLGGFHGCIHEVRINNELQDFKALPPQALGVSPGCKSCSVCKHGLCRAVEKDSVVCECHPGWTGPLCDQEARDPCLGHSCNQGKCVASGTSYVCKCAEGYGGALCDHKNDSASACSAFKCHHGQCHVSDRGEPYCLCQPGFSGEHCEQESPCLGEVVRDVIRRQKGSASCATASKVPVMECRGGCGPQCCQPTRSKRRKYVFQCTDGSSFVEEVERHLECGCRPCS